MTTKTTRKPFVIWKVGNEEYRLKLKSSSICEAEESMGTSLIAFMGSETGMPRLKDMLTITYFALKDWNHNQKLEDIYDLYDQYVEEGGSQLKFYTEIFMMIFQVSGFFSQSQSKALGEAAKMFKD